MKINLKARLKNKTFVVSAITLVLSFVYQALALFGVVPSASEDEVMNVLTMAVNILAFLGVLVDPTTEGMSDSERALTYLKENDVRTTDGVNVAVEKRGE